MCLHFKLTSFSFLLYPVSLTHQHVLHLSRRITGEQELMDLGIKVLRLPDSVTKAALFNKRGDIQSASYAVLSTWFRDQEDRGKAYINLYSGLREHGMNQLAGELKQWVNPTMTSSPLASPFIGSRHVTSSRPGSPSTGSRHVVSVCVCK